MTTLSQTFYSTKDARDAYNQIVADNFLTIYPGKHDAGNRFYKVNQHGNVVTVSSSAYATEGGFRDNITLPAPEDWAVIN